MTDLRTNWVTASLGDVCQFIRGIAFPSADKHFEPAAGLIACLRTKNVQKEVDWSDLWFIPASYVKNEYQQIIPGDILISSANSYDLVGKVALVRMLEHPSTFGAFIGVIRRAEGVDPSFLYYRLSAPDYQNLIRGTASQTTNISNISTSRMLELPFSLPPQSEQRRIAAKLDALFEKSRSIREKLDRLPRLLANLQKSILNSAFRGDLTKEWRANNPNVESASELLKRIRAERRAKWEADLIAKGKDPKKAKYIEPEPVDAEGLPELPEGWCWAPNSLLAEDQPGSICAGPFGTIFKAKDFRSSGIPIIFLRHVGEGKYLTHKPGFMDEEVWKELHQPYSVFGGELLVTKLGDPPGTACIYPQDAGVAMVTPDVMKMCVNGEVADAQYLMHFFNSPVSKGILRELAFGVTRLRIDLAMFKNFPIPLAPKEEQKAIIQRINELFEKARKITSNVDGISERLNTTSSSVLAKAFRGELVPQDPNDEPASVLLERIRAQKPAAGMKRGRGRKAAAQAEEPASV